jgi:adenylosuccinate synthase
MILLAGLGFGDEGKGAITDFLANEMDSKSVVRYNGGPQAAHHVVKNGQVHCFSQFGSGTFKPGLVTYLSKYMLVDPFSLYVEEKALRKVGITDGYKRLFIDNDCLVITPFHKIVGRMREVVLRYGSCGLGVGETVNDSKVWTSKSLRIKDIPDGALLRYKLNFISKVKKDQAEQLADQYNSKRIYDLLKWISNITVNDMVEEYRKMISKINVGDFSSIDDECTIFEGAQGVLLDIDYGFWPYVTKTKTTFDNAYKLIDDKGFGKVGVIRAYYTRHGMGPFVSEDKQLTFIVQDPHNGFNEWQQDFRLGWFDTVATRYSINILGGLDSIALTNLDRLNCFKDIKVCTAYEYYGKDDIDDFFDYEVISGRKIIHDIKVQEPPDIKRQYRLKNLLYNCKPVFTDIKNWCYAKYIDFLESEHITPIRIVSTGPENENRMIR